MKRTAICEQRRNDGRGKSCKQPRQPPDRARPVLRALMHPPTCGGAALAGWMWPGGIKSCHGASFCGRGSCREEVIPHSSFIRSATRRAGPRSLSVVIVTQPAVTSPPSAWLTNARRAHLAEFGPCREGRRKSGSQRTRCWREMDSNFRSPVSGEILGVGPATEREPRLRRGRTDPAAGRQRLRRCRPDASPRQQRRRDRATRQALRRCARRAMAPT